MSRRLYTVDNLIAEVRSLIDEENVDAIDTDLDILPALNRAQDYAVEILAKKYEEPLLKKTTIDLTGESSEIDMPEDIYSDRIEKIEFELTPDRFVECQRIDYRDMTYFDLSGSTVNTSYYYAIHGRKIRFLPKPSGTHDIRLWYVRQPDDLVKPLGRVVSIPGSTDLIIDEASSDLTTDQSDLNSFINVVDGQTGEIKGTYQVANVDDTTLTFRSVWDANDTLITTPVTAPKILNRNLSTSTSVVEPNDYVCNIRGTCVPFFARPLGNFLIQYAVADLKGTKLNGPEDMARRVLEKFEAQINRTWAGRETNQRIKKRSRNWSNRSRRAYWYNTTK